MTMILVSEQLVRIFLALSKEGATWTTSGVIGDTAGVPDRTVRFHLKRLAESGILEWKPVHGGYRYRLNRTAEPSTEHTAYVGHILDAADAFGIEMKR